LNFKGKKKHIVLKNELSKIDKYDNNRSIPDYGHAIISVDQEELSKLFVYRHTNI